MEADNTRIFPHVQESLLRKVSVNIVCIKSPDTDVFILGIRFQKEFRDRGCKELWLITVTSSKKRALGCHITLRKVLNYNCLKFCSHYTHWQGVTLLVSYVHTKISLFSMWKSVAAILTNSLKQVKNIRQLRICSFMTCKKSGNTDDESGSIHFSAWEFSIYIYDIASLPATSDSFQLHLLWWVAQLYKWENFLHPFIKPKPL